MRTRAFSLVELPAVSKAFSLVELLVVLGVIALLMALMAPALHSATQAAHAAFCGSNEHAIGVASSHWLLEHKHRFPEIPNFGTLLGNTGVSTQYGSDKHNEQARPLNKYLGYESGPVRAAQCPADQGDVLSYDQLLDPNPDEPTVYTATENAYRGYGSSYQEAFGKSRWRVKSVFGKLGDATKPSLRMTTITRPDNKVLLGDWPFFGDRRLNSELTQWHVAGLRQFNVLFADMHSDLYLFPQGEMDNPFNKDKDGDPSFFWW